MRTYNIVVGLFALLGCGLTACDDDESKKLRSDASAASGSSDAGAAISDTAPDQTTSIVDANELIDAPGNMVDAPVIVQGPVPGDVFVSPTGLDTANNCSVENMPCKTIVFAAGKAGAARTIWLLDGAYGVTDQQFTYFGVKVGAGLTLRARNNGSAVVRGLVEFAGDNRIVGVIFEQGVADALTGGLRLLSGTNILEGIDFRGNFAGPGSPLEVKGTAIVTLIPGDVAHFAASTVVHPSYNGYDPFIEVLDTATLTIAGGVLDGPGLGYSAQGHRLGYGAAIVVRGSAKLVLDGVTLKVNTNGIGVRNNATVSVLNSTISAVKLEGGAFGIFVSTDPGETAVVNVKGSTISGFASGGSSAAVGLVADVPYVTHAKVSLTDSTLQGSSLGIYVNGYNDSSFTLVGTSLKDNMFGGAQISGACAFDMKGGSVTGNAGFSLNTVWSYHGGLWFGNGAQKYAVKLRGVTISNNRNAVNNGNTGALSNSGLTLGGSAASTFDLGTSADTGGNTITGHNTSAATSNISVATTGVVVSAVGNTFDPNIQGAGPAGLFQLGAAPCAANTCDITSGTGANYSVASGTLRLAAP